MFAFFWLFFFQGTSFQTPINTEEFHLQNNTEILCGPVYLSSYLDLSKRSGTITLTSPKLFRSCCRTLLLHVKALGGFSQEVRRSKGKMMSRCI